MIVWRITGDSVGPNDCGAYYFETEFEALDYRQKLIDADPSNEIDMPDKIDIRTKAGLVYELNAAMGYGGA